MKTVFVGINSKYIHTCLAIWYLKANCSNQNNLVNKEFTINEHRDSILSVIYNEKPDIIAFSCYIWNIEIINALSHELKKLLPKCIIILGGPEVSYNAENVLRENESIDYIVCGEGELVLPVLIGDIEAGTFNYINLPGIAYRRGEGIIHNEGFNLVPDLDLLESPYTGEFLASVDNRILYFESSRGCPYSCSYCISSTFKGVRYFSIDRVKKELNKLLLSKPKLIKFVDRTFNCHRERAREILKYIISLECNTVFHFEAAADLFDDALLELLASAPKGRIQLEIGIQTTNVQTLKEIDRVTNLDNLKNNVKYILSNQNVHMHLDLIAGLPFEDYESFICSFNDVFSLRPHQLQLGFLKMLKGSKIRIEAKEHDYHFRSYPPYEILKNRYITYEEILALKDIEEAVERYYNSNRFTKSIDFLRNRLITEPFELFGKIALYCRENGYFDRPVSYSENIAVLFSFVKNVCKEDLIVEGFRQAMVFDFLSSDSSCAIPEPIRSQKDLIPVNTVHELLREEGFIAKYIPAYKGMQVKNIIKKVFMVSLCLNEGNHIVLFNYSEKDPVSEKYEFYYLESSENKVI